MPVFLIWTVIPHVPQGGCVCVCVQVLYQTVSLLLWREAEWEAWLLTFQMLVLLSWLGDKAGAYIADSQGSSEQYIT